MKRVVIKGLLTLLVVAGAAPFVLPLREGRPLLDWRAIQPPELPQLPELSLPDFGSGGTEPTKTTIYRWRDRDGVWQFGGEPPEGAAFETVEVEPINVMDSPAHVQALGQGEESVSAAGADQPTMPYSPEGMLEAMDRAREAKKRMEGRNEELERALGR